MDESHIPGGSGPLRLLEQIHVQYGLLVLMLVLIIGFGFFLFWKLVWKVWSGALSAKSEEVARVAEERDVYKALVFDALRSAKPMPQQESSSREKH